MKKILFYFDPEVTKILVEKVNELGEKKAILSSPYNFVSRGEIVARVIEIDTEDQVATRVDPGYTYYKVDKYVPLKADEGVFYDENASAYKAEAYGFVIFRAGKLKIISARTITRDKLKAYYTIYPTKFGKIPTTAEMEEYIHNFKILAGIGRKKIEAQLSKIDTSKPKITRVLVAQGKTPVNGKEEAFVPLTGVDKKAGVIKEDGSIDFKEVGSIIQVVKDQEILRRIPPVEPLDGFDIYGTTMTATLEFQKGFKRGQNIVESGYDENIYLAGIDGCLKVVKNKISVLPIVEINGDVNYETGNIEFKGSVHVSGSVLPGFSVKADGDVIVTNTVEDGLIEAGGDITVKMGIVGKEGVKIKAGGTVRAKYLLHANIEAGNNIEIEDSIINCNIFANNMVSVVAKQGKIIGGNVVALYEISAKVIGAVTETSETHLGVGRNLIIEKKLAIVHKEMIGVREKVDDTMRLLKVNFGEGVFENPKELLAVLPMIKKKNCLLLLQELAQNNKVLKDLTEKRKDIEEELRLEREPYIIVYDKIHPGTVLNIKKSVRKIDKIIDNARFYEDEEDKSIHFVAAK
ncbi:MAG: DUF342 domain-containing protein [bacterium]|nr:DUF342 domain-containing protein [bacterium]